jgi:uncharacterized DUF497 family protein
MRELSSCDGFEWDENNINKNWVKHRVFYTECEEVFFNKPLIVAEDYKHRKHENRYYCLGKTNTQRRLFTVFTIRENKIRIISSRDMSSNERKIYEQKSK